MFKVRTVCLFTHYFLPFSSISLISESDNVLTIHGMVVVVGYYLSQHCHFHPVWHSSLVIDRDCVDCTVNQELFQTLLLSVSPAKFIQISKVVCFQISTFLFDDVGQMAAPNNAGGHSTIDQISSEEVFIGANCNPSLSTFSCNDMPENSEWTPSQPVSVIFMFIFNIFYF